MKTAVAILMGFFSGLLIYFIAAMLFADLGGTGKGPSAAFVAVTFLGGWILSSVLLRRGAVTVSKVFSQGFLLGAAEWLVMIAAGIVFSGKAATAAGAGLGIFAFFTGGISIIMAVVCLIGFAVSYFMGREMKR